MLGSLFNREERAIQSTPWGAWPGDVSTTWSGSPVTSSTAMQLLTVYGCVQFICNGISTLPLDVIRESGDKKEHLPTPDWLEYPVVGLHRVGWLTQLLTSLLLSGNAYIAVMRSPEGRIVELIPLDPGSVDVRREQGKRVFYVNGNIPKFDVLHIPAIMSAGTEKGLSPVEAARQTIGAGMAVTEFSSRFWAQGGTFGGVIEDPGPLDPVKAKDTARIWARLHSGKDKAHMPGVLQGGATWKPTAVNNEQAQFLQTRGFTSAEIASFLFLIDPSEFALFMGQGGSITYANLEQRNARKLQVTFLPWIIRIEMALSSLLAKPRFVKFNVNGLLRGDQATRFASYRVALGPDEPFMTADEARGFEDWEPMPQAAEEEPEPEDDPEMVFDRKQGGGDAAA